MTCNHVRKKKLESLTTEHPEPNEFSIPLRWVWNKCKFGIISSLHWTMPIFSMFMFFCWHNNSNNNLEISNFTLKKNVHFIAISLIFVSHSHWRFSIEINRKQQNKRNVAHFQAKIISSSFCCCCRRSRQI